MARDNITNAYVSASVSTIYCDYLAYMDFSGSAPVRLWTGIENKTFTDISGSATYTGIGTFGTISTISETTEVSAKGVELTLSGVPSDYLSLALNNNYRGRTIVLYMVLWNPDRSAYVQTAVFRGRMDQLIINEGEETSTITVKCESRLIELNRAREKRYTDEYQKSIHPADTGLEFISGIADLYIYWGTTSPSSLISRPAEGGGDGNSIDN